MGYSVRTTTEGKRVTPQVRVPPPHWAHPRVSRTTDGEIPRRRGLHRGRDPSRDASSWTVSPTAGPTTGSEVRRTREDALTRNPLFLPDPRGRCRLSPRVDQVRRPHSDPRRVYTPGVEYGPVSFAQDDNFYKPKSTKTRRPSVVSMSKDREHCSNRDEVGPGGYFHRDRRGRWVSARRVRRGRTDRVPVDEHIGHPGVRVKFKVVTVEHRH